MDNLEEMDEFLEKYNLEKLNQKEIEDLNRPITSIGMETVIKIFQKTKAQDQTASQVNSTQKFREELTPTQNYSRKLQRKVNCQTHPMRPPSP